MSGKMLSSIDKGVIIQNQAGEMAFNRLFREILQLPIDKPLAQALLQGMADEKPDIGDVLTIQEDKIDSLTYAVPVKAEEDDSYEKDDGKSD